MPISILLQNALAIWTSLVILKVPCTLSVTTATTFNLHLCFMFSVVRFRLSSSDLREIQQSEFLLNGNSCYYGDSFPHQNLIVFI